MDRIRFLFLRDDAAPRRRAKWGDPGCTLLRKQVHPDSVEQYGRRGPGFLRAGLLCNLVPGGEESTGTGNGCCSHRAAHLTPQGRWGIDSPSTATGWRVLRHRC